MIHQLTLNVEKLFPFEHDFIDILDLYFDNFRILNTLRAMKMYGKMNKNSYNTFDFIV